jgi:hypothetical protein
MGLMSQVQAAVESLYEDELKPYARIVRKRLEERASLPLGAASGSGVDVDMRALRTACEQCSALVVGAEEGGDWFVLLAGRTANFVDVYSPQDTYPPQMWLDAAHYFTTLGEADMVLPGGRYSCAMVLRERHLPFLEGRSLGQVCHIVQLGISQKKLLGYLHGAVVPYDRSQTMLKDKCAQRQRPCAGSDRSELAAWDEVRTCLQEIIAGFTPGKGSIPLSSIKRLFRSRFGKTLSETALGYPKLSELFQDDRLSDLCTVRLQGHGYVLVPSPTQPSDRKAVCLADQVPTFQAQQEVLWMPIADAAIAPYSMSAPVPPPPMLPPDYSMGGGSTFPHLPGHLLQTTSFLPEQFAQPLPVLLGSMSGGYPSNDCRTTYCDLGTAVYDQPSVNKEESWLPKEEEQVALLREQGNRSLKPLTTIMEVAEEPDAKLGQPWMQSSEIQVKNTFINIILPSTLPSACAARRTQSCPRHV